MVTQPLPTLLLTRPHADSQRLADLLPDWRAVISPILRIVPVAHEGQRLRDAPGLVFTSMHAVPSAGPGRGRLAICVGERTGQIAREAGFDVREGNGFAVSMLPLIAATNVPLIHPHGRHLARKLPVEGMVVYDQLAQDLTPQALALLAGDAPVILPLFSPRSVRLVAAQAARARAPLWPVSISEAADKEWDAPAAGRLVASGPTLEEMAAAIRRWPFAEH